MSDCRDRSISKLLPLYELGEVSGVERDQVEQHLLGCKACFTELERIDIISDAIMNSLDTRKHLRDLAKAVPLPRKAQDSWLTDILNGIRSRLRGWSLGWRKGLVVNTAYSEIEPEPEDFHDSRWVISESAVTAINLISEQSIELAVTISSEFDPERVSIRISDEKGKLLHEQTGFDRFILAHVGIVEIESTALPTGICSLEVLSGSPNMRSVVGGGSLRIDRSYS